MTRILLVDDEPAVLHAIATLFTDEGYQVQAVSSSGSAVEIIVLAPPALLITDVMMPGLDGWMVLDRARASVPDLPVIVMSAIDQRKAMQPDGRTTDHTVFLRKPFDIETLLVSVDRLIRS